MMTPRGSVSEMMDSRSTIEAWSLKRDNVCMRAWLGRPFSCDDARASAVLAAARAALALTLIGGFLIDRTRKIITQCMDRSLYARLTFDLDCREPLDRRGLAAI